MSNILLGRSSNGLVLFLINANDSALIQGNDVQYEFLQTPNIDPIQSQIERKLKTKVYSLKTK